MPSITRAKPVGTAPSPATRMGRRSGFSLKLKEPLLQQKLTTETRRHSFSTYVFKLCLRVSVVNSFYSLTTLPADAVACVFEGDAAGGELVADLVGAGEVAAVARLLPLVDEPLDVLVEQRRLLLGEDVQDGVEALDQLKDVAAVVLAQDAGVERGVDLAPEPVDRRERDRGVEGVVHPCLELFEPARRRPFQLGFRARLGARLAQARAERLQRLDRLLRALQALEREVELLAVGHAQQQGPKQRTV